MKQFTTGMNMVPRLEMDMTCTSQILAILRTILIQIWGPLIKLKKVFLRPNLRKLGHIWPAHINSRLMNMKFFL